MVTKPSHISQLLSPPFAKMVEPIDQSFSTVFFLYPRDSTQRTWNPHPNPVSSPLPMTNLYSTTIYTTNSHTKKSKRMHRKPTTTSKNPNPPTALNYNHNLPQKIQMNVQTTSTTAQTSPTTTKNPNSPTQMHRKPKPQHSKPKLGILRLETQITKLDIKMNRFGKRDEREKKCLREKPIYKGRKEREKQRRLDLGWAWTGLIVACGGCSWW